MIRNKFTLPSTVPLTYNLNNYSWQANYHYKGFGEDGFTTEVWDIVFEWACTDEVGTLVTDQVWKIGIYIKVRNLSSYADYDTRLLMVFYPSEVCIPAGVYYKFQLNTKTKVILANRKKIDINIDLNTCYDNIGLFSDDDWISNPFLEISIWQIGSPKNQKLDMSRFMPTRSKLIIP